MKKQVTIFSKKPIIADLVNTNPTMLVFLTTIFAYLVTILYERSYLSVFDVDTSLVELSPVVFFNSIIVVALIYGCLECYVQVYHFLDHKDNAAAKNNHTYKRLLYSIMASVGRILYLTAILFIVSGSIADLDSILNWGGTAGLLMILVLLPIIIPPIVGSRKAISSKSLKKGLADYFEKLDKHNQRIASLDNQDHDWLNEAFLTRASLLVFLICIPMLQASTIARSERSYYVWSTKNEVKSLVIKQYNKTTIIKDYDTRSKKFLEGFTLANDSYTKTFSESYKVEKWKR